MAKITVIFGQLRRFERLGLGDAVLKPQDWIRLSKAHPATRFPWGRSVRRHRRSPGRAVQGKGPGITAKDKDFADDALKALTDDVFAERGHGAGSAEASSRGNGSPIVARQSGC